MDFNKVFGTEDPMLMDEQFQKISRNAPCSRCKHNKNYDFFECHNCKKWKKYFEKYNLKAIYTKYGR